MRLNQVLILLLSAAVQTGLAASSPEVVASVYRADTPFPQFLHLWSEAWALRRQAGLPVPPAGQEPPLGAYIQVYLHNGTAQTLPISGVNFEGVSLADALVFAKSKTGDLYPASVHFSKLPKQDLDRLVAAGEPLWWKVEPPSLPPGGFAEITIRLRRKPQAATLTVEALSDKSACKAVVPENETPRFMGLSFNPGLDTVYGYVQHPQQPGAVPVKVLLDGQDVTARTTIASDKAVDVTPLVIRPGQPLARASFHCFQALYSDGSQATAAIRAWGDELTYGMWGYVNHGKTPQERVDYYLGDLQRHNVNAVMESFGKEVGAFLSAESGLEHSRSLGIRAMQNWPGDVLNPVYYFLTDEPDAHDYAVRRLPANERLGALGQDLVRRSHQIRARDRSAPHLLNLDNTYKPENWYTYAQLPDVCCADPYFQEQQRIVWNERPAWVPSFIKPLYVLGVATICDSACAPKPLHIILNSVRHDIKGVRSVSPLQPKRRSSCSTPLAPARRAFPIGGTRPTASSTAAAQTTRPRSLYGRRSACSGRRCEQPARCSPAVAPPRYPSRPPPSSGRAPCSRAPTR